MKLDKSMNSFSKIKFLNGFITINEAVRISGFNRQYLRRLQRNGRLKGEKIGQMWLIDFESINGYLSKSKKSNDARFKKIIFRESLASLVGE